VPLRLPSQTCYAFLFTPTYASYPTILNLLHLSTPRILLSSFVMYHIFILVLLDLRHSWLLETIFAV
jgi:hypothetical protein